MTFFFIVGLIILIGVLFPDLSNSKTKKEHPASRLGEEDHAAWYLDESRAERQKAMAILKNEILKNETDISRSNHPPAKPGAFVILNP